MISCHNHIKGTIYIAIIVNDGKRIKIARIIRIYSDELEEIEEAHDCGAMAMFGVDCCSMDTFSDGNKYFWNLILDTPT